MQTYPVRSPKHMSDDIASHIAAVRPNNTTIAPYGTHELDHMAGEIGIAGSHLAKLCLDYSVTPELAIECALGIKRGAIC